MQIIVPHPRPTESESVRGKAQESVWNLSGISRGFLFMLKFEQHHSRILLPKVWSKAGNQ